MKTCQFRFSRNAEKTFASLSQSLANRILKKLDFFENAKSPLSFAKKLQGLENIFRFRIGDYRIIVTPIENGEFIVLLILKIGHRREIYRD